MDLLQRGKAMTQAANYIPEVRKQYEEFPYPERHPKDERQRLILPYLSRIDAVNHHCFKGRQNFENFRVLVAGGGTGDNLISWAEQLRTKKGSSVVYLDMSTASANIAKERANIRKLKNITWINDSILNIPNLNLGEFDFVECNGVLHHLKDPDAGLKALTSVLKPTGAMNLMVYAIYGRTGIYHMQNLMRLVNVGEDNPRQKVANTKTMLNQLPLHHWMNVSQKLKITVYTDMENDAGIYDLFLHEQDRAYNILEVHEWLERCGAKLCSEPGYCYVQVEYLPETYIKDPTMLARVKKMPLRQQQAIGEALSGKITKHEFYAVPGSRDDGAATVYDKELIPWTGMTSFITFQEIAKISAQHNDSLTMTFDKLPGSPTIFIPKGKYIADILDKIDGQRSVAQIVDMIMSDSKYAAAKPAEDSILSDFHELMLGLTRGHAGYLRHPSVAPFPSTTELSDRLGRL